MDYLASLGLFPISFSIPISLTIGIYISVNECISICENLSDSGVKMPKFIVSTLKSTKERFRMIQARQKTQQNSPKQGHRSNGSQGGGTHIISFLLKIIEVSPPFREF